MNDRLDVVAGDVSIKMRRIAAIGTHTTEKHDWTVDARCSTTRAIRRTGCPTWPAAPPVIAPRLTGILRRWIENRENLEIVSSYAPYEKDFVLVQWDQRGAGRTFAKNGAAGLTRERLIADGIDLAERLHKRFFGAPLILLGHSWGSIIATGMAQQRPDLFAAYVGTGQAASWADTVQFQFDFLKRRYLEKGDRTRLAALEAIGKPDPKNVALKQIVGAL
jgi:hypothetical protein